MGLIYQKFFDLTFFLIAASIKEELLYIYTRIQQYARTCGSCDNDPPVSCSVRVFELLELVAPCEEQPHVEQDKEEGERQELSVVADVGDGQLVGYLENERRGMNNNQEKEIQLTAKDNHPPYD